jgi:mannose-6-phosphate isomerase-like protein (cupin superfamily)
MRNTILCFTVASTLLMAQSKTDNTKPGTAVLGSDIQASIKKAPADGVQDESIKMIAIDKTHVGVGAVHRGAKGTNYAIIHDALTEVYHILSGSGTLVTGGTVTKPERFPADSVTVKELAGPSWRGAAIQGGTSRKIKAGDLVIIPAGTAHWWSQIDGTIDYEVIRVDPGGLLALK